MENFFWSHWLGMLLTGLLGLLLGWLLFRGKKVEGDLTVEGEGRLRAEADELRAKLRSYESDISARDATIASLRTENEAEVSDLKGKLAAAAAGAAAAGAAATVAGSGAKDDEDTYALEWRNRYLAARVKYLEGRLSDAEADAPKAKPKAKAKTAAKAATAAAAAAATATAAAATVAKAAPAKKKAPAKTAAPKAAATTTARKKPGPKPGTKRGATNLDGTPRKKPGPKPKGTPKKSASELALDKYYENVKKYDGRAKRDVVASIVKYCGVSLKSRDSALVACSDKKELERIANGFARKKLGMGNTEGFELAGDVCAQMKAQRQKSRVTFYYLMAKKAGKLDVFGG